MSDPVFAGGDGGGVRKVNVELSQDMGGGLEYCGYLHA